MRKNIFVIGLEEFNLRFLRTVRHAESYSFHTLLEHDWVTKRSNWDVNSLLERARSTLDAFPGTVDAIVGYWDFPTILMTPILRKRYGLPGPSLESVLKCEHKYWARLLQKEVVPNSIPDFALVDPCAEGVVQSPPLQFPFWIKPVKAHSSRLGFRVGDEADYRDAIGAIRRRIGHFANDLNQIMDRADLPSNIAYVDGWKCIAEQLISVGRQCTLEGYVFAGIPHVYGVVDSIRGPNRSSFERYQYPSTLPDVIQQRMIEIAKKAISHTGLDCSPFNIEFYWNRRTDKIWLLEINARISKSHSPLFEKVHGVPHTEVMIDVALGREPQYPPQKGHYRHAAKFMLRRYDSDGEHLVLKAPDDAEVRVIEKEFPACEINVWVKQGRPLKELHQRDSYSYELAEIFIGAARQEELLRTYREVVKRLNIEIGVES